MVVIAIFERRETMTLIPRPKYLLSMCRPTCDRPLCLSRIRSTQIVRCEIVHLGLLGHLPKALLHPDLLQWNAHLRSHKTPRYWPSPLR